MATGGLNPEPFRHQGHMAHIRQPRLNSNRNPCGVLEASAFRSKSLKRFESLPWISSQVDILVLQNAAIHRAPGEGFGAG